MNILKRLLLIIINPLFLSVLLGCIVLLFIPKFEKYKVELVKNSTLPFDDRIMFYDFDNDGNSENIHYIDKFDALHQSIIIRSKDIIVKQWNFMGKSLNGNFCFFGDYNNDDSHELYFLSHENDSVFLIYFEPFAKNKSPTKKFILETNNKLKDLVVSSSGLYDLNMDGYNEIVFSLSVGFSKHPRRVYAYDIIDDKLIQSPQSCFLIYETFVEDIDADGKAEIYFNGAAYSNCRDTAKYSDQYAWLMLFDNKLNFLFDPFKIGKATSIVQIKPFKPENETLIACLYKYNGTNDSSSIRLFNHSGELLKEKIIPDNVSLHNGHLLSNNRNRKELFIIFKNGDIYEIDKDLNFNFYTHLAELNYITPIAIDFDRDGKNEFLFFYKNNQRIIISRNDFSHKLEIDFPGIVSDFSYSISHQEDGSNQLLFKFDQQLYYYDYYENPIYKFRYIIYIGILILVGLFIYLMQLLQKYRLSQKYEAEKSIVELHIKSLKNQIDPHFTLNIINTIGSLFEQKETSKATYLFEKYIKLLQATIHSSDKVFTTLKNELIYVQNYLDLEQSRLQYELSYAIEVEGNIDQQIEIPKMLIHTFIENAIKHGIRHLESEGHIEIKIKKVNENVFIQIKDNGIGRLEAKKRKTFGTGKGLIIMDQIIDLFQKLKNVRISYEVLDLDNNDENNGTQVNISIPL